MTKDQERELLARLQETVENSTHLRTAFEGAWMLAKANINYDSVPWLVEEEQRLKAQAKELFSADNAKWLEKQSSAIRAEQEQEITERPATIFVCANCREAITAGMWYLEAGPNQICEDCITDRADEVIQRVFNGYMLTAYLDREKKNKGGLIDD
ncbi:MAG: hypothetical protein FWF06_06360 [Symbiobacteriaceae bacterium]|nr:hypothetical protein [Symbiobacteriaceae bacterium]